MEGSNGWNSGYWMDELAKYADGTELAGQNFGLGNNASARPKELQKTWGDLVDVGEPSQKKVHVERDEVIDRQTAPPAPEIRSPAIDQAHKWDSAKSKKKSYNTEQIACTLQDLILGLDSPTIQEAIRKIEQEGKQQHKSSTIVTFESIVEEQKIKAKSYNTGAKEFVPSFAKRG